MNPAEVPGLAGEDRDRPQGAAADAAYRWAAAGVEGRDVLVAGCGHGHGAALLATSGAKSVTATDPDPRAIEAATRMYGDRVRFTAAETTALPLASESFDAVVCVDTPSATIDPQATVAELRRVLAPKGLLMVSVPLSREPGEPGAGPGELLAGFANMQQFRRRIAIAAAIAPAGGSEPAPIESASWLAGEASEDRAVLVAASNGPLPEFPALASLVGIRDLEAQQDTLEAWEERARRAEAEGSAKHWELVAAREAQRRLRMRLHELEHRPLRMLSRVLRGKPARLGEGPPLRVSEEKLRRWE